MAGRRVTTSGPVLIHLLYSTWDGVRRMARNFIHREVREEHNGEHNLVPLVSSFLFDTSQSSTRLKRDWERVTGPVPLVSNLSSTENE